MRHKRVPMRHACCWRRTAAPAATASVTVGDGGDRTAGALGEWRAPGTAASLARRHALAAGALAGWRARARRAVWRGAAPPRGGQPRQAARPRTAGSLGGWRARARRAARMAGALPRQAPCLGGAPSARRAASLGGALPWRPHWLGGALPRRPPWLGGTLSRRAACLGGVPSARRAAWLVPPGGAAVAARSRSVGGQAGGGMVLRQLFCGTAFFTALSGPLVVLVARTAWAAAAAATAVVGATVVW